MQNTDYKIGLNVRVNIFFRLKGLFLSYTKYIHIFIHTLYQHYHLSSEPVGSEAESPYDDEIRTCVCQKENKKFTLFLAQLEVNTIY